jgi:hypothetical protein
MSVGASNLRIVREILSKKGGIMFYVVVKVPNNNMAHAESYRWASVRNMASFTDEEGQVHAVWVADSQRNAESQQDRLMSGLIGSRLMSAESVAEYLL